MALPDFTSQSGAEYKANIDNTIASITDGAGNIDIVNDGTTRTRATSYGDNLDHNFIDLRAGNGTEGSPSILANNDVIYAISAYGWDGNSWEQSALILARVEGIPIDEQMPTKLQFWTRGQTDSGAVVAMTIDKNQNIIVHSGTISGADNLSITKNVSAGDVSITIENSVASGTSETVTFGFRQGGRVAGKIVGGKILDYSSGGNAASFMAFHTTVNNVDNEQARFDEKGNFLLGVTARANVLAGGIVVFNGTPEDTTLANGVSLWAADVTAGDSALFILAEGGTEYSLGNYMRIALDIGSLPAIAATTALIVSNNSASGDNVNISLISGPSGQGSINFGDAANENIGILEYDHTGNYLRIITNTSEQLRVDSAGNLLLNTTAIGTNLAGSMVIGNGTAPTTAPANATQLWAEDDTAESHLVVMNEGLVKAHILPGYSADEDVNVGGSLPDAADFTTSTKAGATGVLKTFTLPAGMLNRDRQGLKIRAWGVKSGTAATVSIQIRIGTTPTSRATLAGAPSGGTWWVEFYAFRVSNTAWDGLIVGVIAGNMAVSQSTNATTDTSWSSAQTLDFNVSSINAADTVTQEGMTVEVLN